MPNWCSNRAVITGPSPVIDEIKQILKDPEGELLAWMVPQPKFEGDQDWYMWNVNNWGCKWNCDAQDWKLNEDGTTISFWFDSPWSPPTVLYETISESYDVDAHYLEEGMAVEVVFYDGRAISVELPTSVVREISYTEPAVKGDTSSGKVLKNAKISTGFEIQVPLFCSTGDKIEIDTRTGEYRSRAN